MSNKRREAEKNLGVFLSPSDPGGGGFVVPMKPLTVGPGDPGPEDEWHVPDGPLDLREDVALEPINPKGVAKPRGDEAARG